MNWAWLSSLDGLWRSPTFPMWLTLAAAAVSYAAARITQLTTLGDVAAANKTMTPELQTLRQSVERDRYGLMAYVLSVRDHCQPGDCAAYRSLTDHNHIAANMDERVY